MAHILTPVAHAHCDACYGDNTGVDAHASNSTAEVSTAQLQPQAVQARVAEVVVNSNDLMVRTKAFGEGATHAERLQFELSSLEVSVPYVCVCV